ncbi:MAG: serine/threonine protein kinase [Lachnospiraceae bacterium]|nr:serine/threonine protein kinase [Lachnospiraceae bacterium]
MAKIGTVLAGKYEILKQIGKGGISVVYLAMDKNINKQWAVKEVRKQGESKNDMIPVNSLLAEFDLIKRLDHPALPRIVDIMDERDVIYVVMDYIEGESLDKILLGYGPQPEEIVIEWAKQICDVLDYLHSQKPPIIYRDMKPANVMLKPEGNVKIIDFGIAREYKEMKLADTTVLGTPGYASPEHRGARQTDARSDIFTLGMTMHHLVTGVDPRPADYMYASVRQWNPDLSEGIERIIDKCTALNHDDRYQNCMELMYDLEHPDELTNSRKREKIRKLRAFQVSTAVSVLLLLSGFGCKAGASYINQNTYEELISITTASSLEDKIDNYKKAINIYPVDTTAYTYMLEAYETEGRFSKAENDEFLALYNAHKEDFNMADAQVAELNYRIGLSYFNYYTNEDGSYSFANRVQKAYPFFETNFRQAQDFENKILSDCYYQICSFYKKYILSSVTLNEASRDDYLQLFDNLETTLETISGAGAHDQLAFYNGIFMLLNHQTESMASVEVEKDMVLSLMDRIYEKAKNLSVQKEQSKALQKEIVDNYEDKRADFEITYANIEERR